MNDAANWIVSDEKGFRDQLCGGLYNILPHPDWRILKGKNVADILVAYQDEHYPKLFFLEAKWYRQINGRIGIGNQRGGGYQTEYLLHPLAYLETNLRWIVGEENSQRCWLFTNEQIRSYASGKRIGSFKQNNLSARIFKDMVSPSFDLKDSPQRIASWMQNSIDRSS